MFDSLFRNILRSNFKYKRYFELINNYYINNLDYYSYQELLFKKLLIHAYKNVPYYNKLFNDIGYNPNNFKSLDDLQKIPILTKDILKSNYNNLISNQFKNLFFKKGYTSGTTGSPVCILRDYNSIVFEEASINWHWSLCGWNKNSKIAILRGKRIKPVDNLKPPFWKYFNYKKELVLSSYHLNEKYIKYYVDELIKFNPNILRAYPSTTYLLAKYLNDINKNISIPYVYTASEPLYPIQRELIEKRLNSKIFDFYGQAERVIFGFECKYNDGFHLNPLYGIAELVETDNNGFGYLVGTSLNNYSMPLIRYKLDDTTRYKNNSCRCGSNMKLIEPIFSKSEDYIRTKDERKISGSLVTFIFKPFIEIKESQIIQHENYDIEIIVVPASNYTEKNNNNLINSMKSVVGTDINVCITLKESIERSKNAKFKWIISKI